MSIRRRPRKNGTNVYLASYRAPDGKEHSKTFKKKGDATKWLNDQKSDIDNGKWVDPSLAKITLGALVEAWITSDLSRSESTIYRYRSAVKYNFPPLIDYPVGSITTKIVNEWYRQLLNGRPWISKDDKGLSETTALGTLRVLQSAFLYAVERGIIKKSPVKVPKGRFGKPVNPQDIPTAQELEKVEKRIREGGAPYMHQFKKGEPLVELHQRGRDDYADIIILLSLTGMRISELLGLTPGDIDMDNRAIMLNYQLDSRTKTRGNLKTESSRRRIPLSGKAFQILMTRAEGKGRHDFIFTGRKGQPLTASKVSLFVTRAADYEGVQGFHPHTCRHFFASVLIGRGMAIQEVSRLLGHASISTTLTTYTHIIDNHEERARDIITSAIDDAVWSTDSAE